MVKRRVGSRGGRETAGDRECTISNYTFVQKTTIWEPGRPGAGWRSGMYDLDSNLHTKNDDLGAEAAGRRLETGKVRFLDILYTKSIDLGAGAAGRLLLTFQGNGF